MSLKRAKKPTTIQHDFSSSFGGELCPICREVRLVAALEYPVCLQCRRKYELDEAFLKKLAAYRLMITQDEINWKQKPYPTITGQIDDIPWEAIYTDKVWTSNIEESGKEVLTDLVDQYLNRVSPAWINSAEGHHTKIRRYAFFVAVGSATLVTAGLLAKKYQDKQKRILKEAEEAEREGSRK